MSDFKEICEGKKYIFNSCGYFYVVIGQYSIKHEYTFHTVFHFNCEI